jgi:hypothetical protein
MIELSHSRRFIEVPAILVLAMAAAVAGCCGGAPSHQCMFVPPPPPPRDAAAETSLLCGSKACPDSTVCCLTKIPPFATCVSPADYQVSGCEDGEVACASPTDCPGGLVCCNDGAGRVTCKPDQLCPGDGKPTYRICDGNADCPRVSPTCTSVANPDPEAGVITLSICL